MSVNIQAFFCGHVFTREQVQAWERRRAQIVLKKLGIVPTQPDDLLYMRRQLMERKLALGVQGVHDRLRTELAIATPATHAMVRLSFGRRRFSVTELLVEGGSAQKFVQWFNERTAHNDETAMLAACPDHYVIRTLPNGAQEVIETTGGAPMVSRFLIDYQDLSSLRSIVDPAYPLQIAGVARSESGLVLGGVRHQFKPEGGGFRAKLTVEFPALIFPEVIEGHQWHLACEFSNWIEAAFA